MCWTHSNLIIWTLNMSFGNTVNLCKCFILQTNLKTLPKANKIVFVLRINWNVCSRLVKQLGQPVLFPDIRCQWHWKSLQKAFPLTAIAGSCSSLRLWILRLSVCMQRKFQLPILLYQNTILSASDVQLLLSVRITFSLSLFLSLSPISFHFLPKALIYILAFTSLKKSPLWLLFYVNCNILWLIRQMKRNNSILILIPKTFVNEKAIKVFDM